MIYTVQQLIDALKDLPPHAAVHVWDDGDRLVIESVDKVDETTVDLNICGIELAARSNSSDEINRLREQLHEMRMIVGRIHKLSGDA